MKKIIALFLVLALGVACISPAFAAEPAWQVVSQTTEYLPDGTPVTVTVSVQPTFARASTYTVNGKKDYTYGDQWVFTVYGTFTVTQGVSASCTADRYTYSIGNSEWSLISGSSSHSGATATASGTMRQSRQGHTLQTVYPSVSVSCDKYGNLS